jgi:hypothetical protein
LASKLRLKLKRPLVAKDKLYTKETFDLIRELAPYKSASAIASMIGSTPSSLYNKCLAAGIKMKREKRKRHRLSVELGNKVVEELDAIAAKRNISLETLVRNVMNIIVKDKMINAILDGEEPARKMKTLTLACSADWHIGVHTQFSEIDDTGRPSRLLQFESLSRDFFKFARDTMSDAIVIAGDIVDQPVIRPMVADVLYRVVGNLTSYGPLILTHGQHDLDTKTRTWQPITVR